MAFRITSIERMELDSHYRWHLKIKGIRGNAINGEVLTGQDGYGLCCRVFIEEPTELLPPDRIHAHPRLTAEQVAHRVAAGLLCLGWGAEDYDDRESMTHGRPVRPVEKQQSPS